MLPVPRSSLSRRTIAVLACGSGLALLIMGGAHAQQGGGPSRNGKWQLVVAEDAHNASTIASAPGTLPWPPMPPLPPPAMPSMQSVEFTRPPGVAACTVSTVTSIIVGLSRCGSLDSDIRATISAGGQIVGASWIDGDSIQSTDILDPTWVDVFFNPPITIDPALTYLVELKTEDGNVVSPSHIPPPSVNGSSGGATNQSGGSQSCITQENGSTGEYLWSVDTTNPYPDGAYLGDVISKPGVATQGVDALLKINMAEVARVKVLVVAYDPIIEARGGQRMHQVAGYHSPYAVNASTAQALQTASGETVRYDLEYMILDQWPLRTVYQYTGRRRTGQIRRRYNDAEFLADLATGQLDDPVGHTFAYYDPSTDPDSGRPNGLVNQPSGSGTIVDRINAGEIDEIWVWGDPTAAYSEAAMGGPGAFGPNGITFDVPGATRRFVVMGYNMALGHEYAMHSYGHRAETILARRFGWIGGYPPVGNPVSTFDHYTTIHHDHPGQGSVGTVHHAHNGRPTAPNRFDADWSNRFNASSDADDWFNWPLLTGQRAPRNCDAWNCSQSGYMDYWFDRLPEFLGETNGQPDNWWSMFVHPDCFQ